MSVSVGESAPDFALPDALSGKTVRLSEARKDYDALLVFFRGTWCPFCRAQMTILRDNQERLTAAGIVVLGIVCQSRVSVQRFLETDPLPFSLLIDETRSVSKQYGTHYWLSLEGANLSHPALFVLDQGGVVTLAHIGRNMRDLPVTVLLEKFLQMLPASSDAEEKSSTTTLPNG